MDPICLECGRPIVKDKRSKKIRSTKFHQGCRTIYRSKLKPVECACGCGELLFPMDQNGYFHKFKAGHFAKTRSWEGENNPKYNRYKCKAMNGYILIRDLDHPFKDNRGYIPEHHFVWEQEYNAILMPWANVHHKDHKRSNNVWYNLQAMMKPDHDRLESHNRVRDNLGRFT